MTCFSQDSSLTYVSVAGFAKVLDDGWNLEAVREIAYACLARAGKDKMHFRYGLWSSSTQRNTYDYFLNLVGWRLCIACIAGRRMSRMITRWSSALAVSHFDGITHHRTANCVTQITCGVHVDVLDEVQHGFRKAFEDERLRARIMVSGRGDWRFVDIVSHGAGKLSALECGPVLPVIIYRAVLLQ